MIPPHGERQLSVLIADDDPVDRMLVEEAFTGAQLPHALHFVSDGVELLGYLDAALAGDSEKRLPDLILLDLNMPRKNGHEALTGVRERPATAHIPVVILTTSQAPSDVRRAYELGAVSFIMKPADFDDLTDYINRVVRYWLEVIVHPADYLHHRPKAAAQPLP